MDTLDRMADGVYNKGMTTTQPTNAKETKMTKKEAIAKLIEMEATHEKKEDSFGDTKSGWWMDTVWLAPYSQPLEALAVIEGN